MTRVFTRWHGAVGEPGLIGLGSGASAVACWKAKPGLRNAAHRFWYLVECCQARACQLILPLDFCACDWIDFWVWNGAVHLVSYIVLGFSWVSRFCDEYVVNLGFDESCKGLTFGGKSLAELQNGRVQNYLRVIGIALAVLALLLIWGWHPS